MPTFSKLVCGAILAIVAVIISEMIKPELPSAYDVTFFTYRNASISFLMGWKVLGTSSGRGWLIGISNGITAVLSACFLCLLVYAIGFMFNESFKTKYKNIFEAIDGMLTEFMNYAAYLNDTNIISLLVGAMVVSGILGEMVKRRWD